MHICTCLPLNPAGNKLTGTLPSLPGLVKLRQYVFDRNEFTGRKCKPPSAPHMLS